VKQRLVNELVNAKLIMLSDVGGAIDAETSIGPYVNTKLIAFSDVGGAIGADLEAYVSLIRAKIDTW
jgi:hypothetical protein